LLVVGEWQFPDSAQAEQSVAHGMEDYHVVFGRCIVQDEPVVSIWSDGQWDHISDAVRDSAGRWQRTFGVEEANRRFPVVERVTIPARGLFLLVVAFAVVIGPVNLLVLSRKKARIRLLWTTPAIALLSCLAVLGYAFVTEGWRGTIRAATLTVLDQPGHRATTVGWLGTYSPLTPRRGLRFGYDVEVTPMVGTTWWQVGEHPRQVDLTADQHLATGWISARVPAFFNVRCSEFRRERLAVTRTEDGSLRIVNGLGAEIEVLWLADSRGNIYRTTYVAAGAEKILKSPVPGLSAGEGDVFEQLHSEYLANRAIIGADFLDHRKPAQHLIPASYLAVSRDMPFLTDALDNVKERKYRSVVFGIIGEDCP
jgi:hypothetical protein